MKTCKCLLALETRPTTWFLMFLHELIDVSGTDQQTSRHLCRSELLGGVGLDEIIASPFGLMSLVAKLGNVLTLNSGGTMASQDLVTGSHLAS